MAGRKLRRQRADAIAALSDEHAATLARETMRHLNDSQALAALFVASGAVQLDRPATMPEVRQAVADLVAADPATARLVVSLHWHLPSVERALGLTRTQRQQLT